ncbi:Anaerobic ribonucleoside-triphosphate reductase-activating protein [Commensalibacter sp. Nvir]|uniref:anaerobic ribonucleoside-triphosphate reductase activating protein n=1 Tax=Commensalibacter sp. Nvir TaxID=3069817 RepID=UPI002D30F766|nr:Anaerobic ribonucleoside-triphosphate reductase-activating protein [Commensalibacter sp. Nvir]
MAAPKLHLSGIIEESIVDGPGIRFVIFTQGCPHFCPGCQNPETQPFSGGYYCNVEKIFINFQKNPLLSGITFSGGEPFIQACALVALAKMVNKIGKTVVTYTGYTFERLLEMSVHNQAIKNLLNYTDLLIDGPFLLSYKNSDLLFRGSSNQRLLDRKCRSKIEQKLYS